MTGLLADFATRLALGVAVSLLAAPWRDIPPRFFQTMCLVLVGILVLACFDLGFGGAAPASVACAIVASISAYAATIGWGLGFPRLGQLALILVAALAAAIQWQWVALAPKEPAVSLMVAASRICSAGVLGATLTAMLLGHHYLTAPTMSIEPLKRMILLILAAIVSRAALAAWIAAQPSQSDLTSSRYLFEGMRWGFGIIAPLIGTILAWKTAAIRSTQSATGILYAVTTLAFLGELSALVLGRTQGFPY